MKRSLPTFLIAIISSLAHGCGQGDDASNDPNDQAAPNSTGAGATPGDGDAGGDGDSLSGDGDSTGDGDSSGDGDGSSTGDGDGLCMPATPPPPTAGCLEEEEFSLTFPCDEEVRILAIAAYESDKETPAATLEQVEEYLNSDGYQGRWSVGQRISQLTGGRTRVRFVVDSVQLPETLQVYMDDTSHTEFHVDAVEALQQKGFDFSQLTQLPDGSYYPFFTISLGDFWATPHAGFYLRVDEREYQGYSLTYYEPSYEVGVMVHELGHSLFRWGEFYDWDTDTPNAGVGNWGPMAHGFSGAYNPFIRQCKGWNVTFDIADDRFPLGTRFDLPANSNIVLRYRTDTRPQEYFMIEVVERSDVYPDLPDEGLLIWHIDENMEREVAGLGADQHNKVALEQADGTFGMETDPSDFGGEGDAFRAGYREAFGEATTPSSTWWDGTASGLEISAISEAGSRMSFILGPPGTEQVGETVTLELCGAAVCEVE